MTRVMTTPDLAVRWTIGDVSARGFEALRLSVWGAVRVFGPSARYVVCVNSLPLDVARERVGTLPPGAEWHDVTGELWRDLEPYLGPGMAEGVAWKFAPLRVHPDGYELALDNDCILWEMPDAIGTWLGANDACLLAEDVLACFGKFASLCGDQPRNSGVRGMPPGFDLAAAIMDTLHEQAVTLTSELDEQGLEVAALSRHGAPEVVTVDDVSICSPFPPHRAELGACGAHFVGTNSRDLGWELDGAPAVTYVQAHWERHRPALYEHVGIRPERAQRADSCFSCHRHHRRSHDVTY